MVFLPEIDLREGVLPSSVSQVFRRPKNCFVILSKTTSDPSVTAQNSSPNLDKALDYSPMVPLTMAPTMAMTMAQTLDSSPIEPEP